MPGKERSAGQERVSRWRTTPSFFHCSYIGFQQKKWSRLKVCSLSLRSGLKTCVTQLQDPNQRHVVFLSQDPDQDLEVCSPFLDSRSLQIFRLTTKNSPHKSGMPANEEAETGGPQSPGLFELQSEFYSGQCRETQCQSKKQREDWGYSS